MSSPPRPLLILIVEDDLIVREIVAAELRREGFDVIETEDLASARQAFARRPADLVLTDVNLPDGAGFDLVEDLTATRDPAVIYMTTRGSSVDRIHGLETGGDDYVVKPIDVAELLARVRAVLRRYNRRPEPVRQDSVLVLSGWTLDLVRRELADPHGQVIDLTRGEFDLFAALVQTRATLDRDYLMEVISSAQANPSLRTIDVLVSRIRRKFADLPQPAPRILTVPRLGYAIEMPQD
jgi:two-component system torCAD operon response regulator TorR